MALSRSFRFWLLPPLLVAMAVIADLAATLLCQGFKAGVAEAGMLVWILAFVVGLPALLLLLPLLRRITGPVRRHRIIPLLGVKIPDLGQ